IERLAMVKAQYVQPRCDELQAGFALYRGNVERASADTPRNVTVGGRPYWTAALPALVCKDIAAAESGSAGGVLFSLADRRKMEPFRVSAAWKDSWSLITVGNDTVAAASHVSPMPQGLLLETTVPLEKICKRVIRRKLPADL